MRKKGNNFIQRKKMYVFFNKNLTTKQIFFLLQLTTGCRRIKKKKKKRNTNEPLENKQMNVKKRLEYISPSTPNLRFFSILVNLIKFFFLSLFDFEIYFMKIFLDLEQIVQPQYPR